MREIGRRVLPVYLAIDVSGSMAGQSLASVEQALLQFADELAASPILGDTVRVAIIEFSDYPEVILPLSDMTRVRAIPRLRARGATNLGALFVFLEKLIRSDIHRLRGEDAQVFRPLVLLLTDGLPTDNWRGAHESFMQTARANLIVIAHEDVDGSFLEQLRALRIYRWTPWDGPGRTLSNVVIEMTQSLVRSTVVTEPRLPNSLQPPGPISDVSDEWV